MTPINKRVNNMKPISYAPILLALCVNRVAAAADDSTARPRNTPLTRPEMKEYLEDMKHRKPRIPLPEMTAEEREKYGEGDRGYEARLRSVYMPSEGRGGFRGGSNSNAGAARTSGSRDRAGGGFS